MRWPRLKIWAGVDMNFLNFLRNGFGTKSNSSAKPISAPPPPQKRILVLGSKHPKTDSFEWDKLPETLTVSDFDAIIVNLVAFEERKDLQTSLKLDKIPSRDAFREFLFSKNQNSMMIFVGDPSIELRQSTSTSPQGWSGGYYVHEIVSWLPGFPPVVKESTKQVSSVSPGPFGSYLELVRGAPVYLSENQRWEWIHETQLEHYLVKVHGRANAITALDSKCIAKNRQGHPIAISFRYEVLHDEYDRRSRSSTQRTPLAKSCEVVWLPAPTTVTGQEGVQRILNDIFGHSQAGEAPPDWIENFVLPNEAKLNGTLTEIEAQIADLQARATEIAQQKALAGGYKRMLYATGKVELEPIIRQALRDLGAEVTESGKDAGGNELEDSRLTYNGRDALVEFKGLVKGCKLDDIRQLMDWLNRAADKGLSAKGIAVINGFRKQPPDQRDKVFENQVVTRAQQLEICLITTYDLYMAIVLQQRGEFDVEEFWAKVFATNGIYT